MRKPWMHCLLWSLVALSQGVAAATTREVRPVNGDDASSALASSAFAANRAPAPAVDCYRPSARRADSPVARGIIQTSGVAPRGDGGSRAEVAAYVRLHHQARTDIPFDWRPLGACVLP